MLVLFGAALYGVSNVGQEFVVRSFDRVEFLGMIGLFGCIINGIQLWETLMYPLVHHFIISFSFLFSALLERQEVASIDFSSYQVGECILQLFLLDKLCVLRNGHSRDYRVHNIYCW
jgi:solute carrier family 35 protein F1/2